MTGLLERESELGELSAALAKVEAGNGAAITVEAGAGLGKTALLAECRALGGAAGLTVLSARMTELEHDFPFALIRQLFEPQLTALSGQDREAVFEGADAARAALGLNPERDPGEDSFAVLHALYWITAALAERGPLLLSIDDGHLADAVSVDYLRFLLPRLEELPVLMVLAVRPEEVDAGGGLGQVIADASMRHLDLNPLSPEATAAFLEREFGSEPEPKFVAACHEVSGGNPFLLSELSRTLGDQRIDPTDARAAVVREVAPERVARMFQARIARLAPAARSLVNALAVLGDNSELQLVGELAGLEDSEARDVADQLRASGVFSPSASPQFIHPLVRNAIYADIPVGDRAEAHARAARLLRDRGGGPEPAAAQLLATEANGSRETVETLIDASERALASGAPDAATTYLTRALREPPPMDLRTAVLGPLIIASFRNADYSLFQAVEADAFAELDRDPSLRKSWTAPLTRALAIGGRFEEAVALIQEAVELAVAEDDVEAAFRLEAQLSTLSLLVPSVPEVDLGRYADRIDPESSAGRLLAAMEVGPATLTGNASESVRAAKRALGSNGAIFAEDPEMFASMGAVLTLAIAEEEDAARYGAERAMAIAIERGATPEIARASFLRGWVSWAIGDLPAAAADVRQSVELSRLAQFMPGVVMGSAALIDLLKERDELDAAEEELQATGMAAGPLPVNTALGVMLVSRGQLRFEQGALEDAVEDFLAIMDGARDGRLAPMMLMTISPYAARALVALGDRDQASAIADEAIVAARRWGAPAGIAHALRAVAAAEGGAKGISTLAEATEVAKKSRRRLERAYVLVELGVALRRENRRADSRAPLREGFEMARRCGAARLAKWANAELQASGEKVRRYMPIGVESLTPSERRVAELAASGMTNRQIAQSLFVTLKTVEAHLSATYDKLDIKSRSQLAAALEDQADPPG